LLRSAVSDYIDRIVDGRELHQRVITQPRPEADIANKPLRWVGPLTDAILIRYPARTELGASIQHEASGIHRRSR
jgi:hypothetical protein